jgi:uncharacterized membrane protein YccC
MPMITQPIRMHAGAMWPKLPDWLANARVPLLFGVRLWASVCLAMFIAFWLQLDEPVWAGTSAAVVCQPQLGAALRKGWFRMIGTVVGAVMIVLMTACFPQDRIAFFAMLALWVGICAFIATVLRNFASYAASLAGYTSVIVSADTLGATGGPSSQVFLLAIYRASEICIGIACAGVVLAGTDLGGAQKRLAAALSDLAADIAGGFIRTLSGPDPQAERRQLLRRVIGLDPMIDQALGESGYLHNASLQIAVHGLLAALVAWRRVAIHLGCARDGAMRGELETVLPELRSTSDPASLRRLCEASERTLLTRTADTPSQRLLLDETAKVMHGLASVYDELALLAGAPGQRPAGSRNVSPGVADWLPAVVNGARAFVTIAAVELLWVVTAWPNGGVAIVLAAIVLLLLSPKGDLAYKGSVALALTAACAIVVAAVVEFAVLPAFETFFALCATIGIVLVPIGLAAARTRTPALTAVLGGMAIAFFRLIAPTNPMIYDTGAFYNTAVGIFVGCSAGPLAFCLLPPLSPALRARRLLTLNLRDLRRLAIGSLPAVQWERRMYDRFAALPDDAEPLQRAQLLAALSVGSDIDQLRDHGLGTEFVAALVSLANGNSALTIARLHQIGSGLALPQTTQATLRVRGRIAAFANVLAEHGSYFDSTAAA